MKKWFLKIALFMILIVGSCFMANQSFARTSSSWSAVGSGVDFPVASFAVYNNELYVGGTFTNFIAKWNGTSWSQVGSGMDNYVYTMAVYNNKLYAGGAFTTAGGIAVTYIAEWDGSNWRSINSGMDDEVRSLAVYGNNLYVGGFFTAPVSNIAKWDGSSWSAVGSGMDNDVYALAEYNNELYAAGSFTTPAAKIAKWNGTAWSSLTLSSTSDRIRTLAVYNNELYAGGDFITAGGHTVNYIARWDGTNWNTVGTGMAGSNTHVYSLAVYNNELYAGGSFTTAGGTTAYNIAKWNGSSWSPAGSGMTGTEGLPPVVFSLAVYNDELYAGGTFITAGDVSVNYIASWYIDTTAPTTVASPVGGTYTAVQNVTLTATDTDSPISATYYTIDGSTPTISSSVYSAPISITEDTTLKFFSVDSAGNVEEVKTETYEIDLCGTKVTLASYLSEQKISCNDSVTTFKYLPTKLTKNNNYWMKLKKQKGYPDKTFLKKWKLTTNLYKYKVKKSSQKYKIKVSFKFTKKQLKKYLKKNKSATKSNLYLKYKKGTGVWQNINTAFTDAKIIKKDKKFIVKYFTKYPVKTQYFAIGVK
ncbi:MAG: chitobiase/beta-hexosaminidase C-terminal domain-containing protein [Patescibacteria group bacterium]|nr:chitobiase/beta-hexosaminidase C-terminal domain-containing protein [Patescibacteria group bacterium]